MSKNHYHNYSKQYKSPDAQEQPIPATSTADDVTIVAPEIPPLVDATIPVPDEIIEPEIVESTPELPTTVTGVVSGCKKLNVRTRPNITAGIITTVNEGTEVAVAQPIVDGDFYKVTLVNGTTGYCMKKFIAVK